MINFCYDKIAAPNIGYPNLAQWPARPFTSEWRQFDKHWPHTVPLRLTMYLDTAQISYTVSTVSEAPKGSWYPIAFSWFDFECDYFGMLSSQAKLRIKAGEIKILFYYHEGDNPQRIQEHLYHSRIGTLLPKNCFFLISANSAADQIPAAVYFSDHEFFFRHINRKQRVLDNSIDQVYDFTVLNRTHKWWRASIMSDLLHHSILEHSQWSYNTNCIINENYDDNPIEVDTDYTWRERMHKFVSEGPYVCDEFTVQTQNDHHWVNTDLYSKSYFHIVVETHFDADQSGGTFITEKTWKPIKFGQPFVVVGPAGTLSVLRTAGYRVFDDVLDNTYDTIQNNTDRWIAIRNLLISMRKTKIAILARQCADDIKHNQQMFESRQAKPLKILLEKIQCQI